MIDNNQLLSVTILLSNKHVTGVYEGRMGKIIKTHNKSRRSLTWIEKPDEQVCVHRENEPGSMAPLEEWTGSRPHPL